MSLKEFLRKKRLSFSSLLAAGAVLVSAPLEAGQNDDVGKALKMTQFQKAQLTLRQIDVLCISGLKKKLKDREGDCAHLYLDSRGILHTGVGINVSNYEIFKRLDFTDSKGNLFTEKQKRAYYAYVMLFRKKQAKKGFNYKASYYAANLPYRPTAQSRQTLFDEKVQQSVDAVKKMLGAENYYNLNVVALQEMGNLHYNLGSAKFNCEKFPKFFAAAKCLDYATMAKEAHIKGISKTRNLEVKNALQWCAKVKWKNYGTMAKNYAALTLALHNGVQK